MSEKIIPQVYFEGEWKCFTEEESKMMQLKQAIREVLNEMDFRCPKCKCEAKDE